MSKHKCTFNNVDGTPCSRYTTDSTGVCHLHRPAYEKEQKRKEHEIERERSFQEKATSPYFPGEVLTHGDWRSNSSTPNKKESWRKEW